MELKQMQCTVISFRDKKCTHDNKTKSPIYLKIRDRCIIKLQSFVTRKIQVIRCLDDRSDDNTYRRNTAHGENIVGNHNQPWVPMMA